MKTLFMFLIASMLAVNSWAGSYTVIVPDEMEPVLAWEANNTDPTAVLEVDDLGVLQGRPLNSAEVVQKLIDNFLSERAGHYNDPRERLKRLSASDKAQIPPPIRKALGID